MEKIKLPEDLKWIKEHFGENMMKFCRANFSKILVKSGMLKQIFSDNFEKQKNLYNDIIQQKKQENFVDYIFDLYNRKCRVEKYKSNKSQMSVAEMFDKSGYILFPECKTNTELLSYKKYWPVKDEELCSFHDGARLRYNRVWFAVKKDIDKIQRAEKPDRQDSYGTSAISIQFSKIGGHLSIKNRYNHTVDLPDSTFDNDLDNIYKGLDMAFRDEFDLPEKTSSNLYLARYVCVDKKFYRFYLNSDNFASGDYVYYCTNNTKIMRKQISLGVYDNNITQLPTSQILAGGMIFDIKNKSVRFDDDNLPYVDDSICSTFKNIESITYNKGKSIVIKQKDKQDVVIGINEFNEIKSYTDPNIVALPDNYMTKFVAEEVYLPNCKTAANNCLSGPRSQTIKKVEMEKLESCGHTFLNCTSVEKVSFPNLESIGDNSMHVAENLKYLLMPKVKKIGDYCLVSNSVKVLIMENLESAGNSFMRVPRLLEEIDLPKLKSAPKDFLHFGRKIRKINLPNVTKIEDGFAWLVVSLEFLNMPKIKDIKGGETVFSDGRIKRRFKRTLPKWMQEDRKFDY